MQTAYAQKMYLINILFKRKLYQIHQKFSVQVLQEHVVLEPSITTDRLVNNLVLSCKLEQ